MSREYARLVGHAKRDHCDVYVGRGSNGDGEPTNLLTATRPGEHGWLGNPYPVEQFGRRESVAMFTYAFLTALERRPELRRAVVDRCRGKVLGCWCQRLDEGPPQADLCHAEVIAQVADRVLRRPRTDGGTVAGRRGGLGDGGPAATVDLSQLDPAERRAWIVCRVDGFGVERYADQIGREVGSVQALLEQAAQKVGGGEG